MNNIHPRHCLELCTKYQQKYALINGNKCFCTNIPVKNDRSTIILTHQVCSLKCSANYFYTCGNKDNETIYSMYIMKPQCLHGKRRKQSEDFSIKNLNLPVFQVLKLLKMINNVYILIYP
jgi:hypothetical protein